MTSKITESAIETFAIELLKKQGYRFTTACGPLQPWGTGSIPIIKGFAVDDERLKQIKHFGQDYFDELLERIRVVRDNIISIFLPGCIWSGSL